MTLQVKAPYVKAHGDIFDPTATVREPSAAPPNATTRSGAAELQPPSADDPRQAERLGAARRPSEDGACMTIGLYR